MKRLVLNLGQKELKRARHRCLRCCRCLVATCVSSPPGLLAQLAVAAVHKTCFSSSSSSSLLLSAHPSRSGRVVIEAGTAHHRAGGAVCRGGRFGAERRLWTPANNQTLHSSRHQCHTTTHFLLLLLLLLLLQQLLLQQLLLNRSGFCNLTTFDCKSLSH